jgi:hypothetical protein
MKIISLLLLSFLSFSTLENDPEKMPWSETRRLTWADFQGTPNRSDDFVASTNSGISFSYSISNRDGNYGFRYTVLSNFYPKDSWYKPESASEYILKHEQTHFDISELYARKLRKKLESLEIGSNIKDVVDQLYVEIEQQRRAMQAEYDRDSDHSKNRDGEFRWREFVAGELQKYDNWK